MMVGEEVVYCSSVFKCLCKSEGEKRPLISNGYSEPFPHLMPAAHSGRAAA
jgi:hypothetical protein